MVSSLNYLTDLIEENLRNLPLPHQPGILYDPIHYTLSIGGKRIRPRIVLLSCGLCGSDPEEALPAAMALEMLHNFTLIHDDIMDKADMRRGRPSVFKKWDSSTAILSGDAMFAHALQQLHYYGTDNRYSKDLFVELEEEFLAAVITVCRGQALDLEFEADYTVTIDQYMAMVEQKTAALVSSAFRMGAIVAGATAKEKDDLWNLGHEIGIAFQIQDDLMDVTADPDRFGKKTGGDIYERKMTFLFLTALSRADDVQKEYLMSLKKSRKPSHEDILRVLEIYNDLGVIEEAQRQIRFHYRKALDYLKRFKESDYRVEIEELLNTLLERES